MTRFGSAMALLAGSVLVVAGLFGMASASSWTMIMLIGVVAGLGSGIVDAGLNMYVATYHTARQMNWLHACFGLGVTFGPLIMTFVLQKKFGWHVGYAVVGVVLLAMVLMFATTRKLWRNEGLQTAENKPVRRASFGTTLRIPVV